MSSSLSDYDYPLPPEAVAQRPVEPRSAARMLVDLGESGDPQHRTVAELPDLVRSGDVVVVNETRVLPARLALRKATGGAAEVFLLEPHAPDPDGAPPLRAGAVWSALVRPGRRLPDGTRLVDESGAPVVEVGPAIGDDGVRRVTLLADPAAHGSIPLPPYIHEALADPERYQTVYARTARSVAAPTAGLHLTPEVLDGVRAAGAAVHTVDLAVGLGTFRPITADRVDAHVMHEERYSVPDETREACRSAERVVAIGTTTVRALESAARGAPAGRTDLFIRPGFRFQVVDALLTNFHLPKSSLLVLLSAFAGHDRWRRLYGEAIAEGYRFLSFGDCMLVSRADDAR